MFFILFTLGFVAVVMTCMIMINRWMVSKRPKEPGVSDRDQVPTATASPSQIARTSLLTS